MPVAESLPAMPAHLCQVQARLVESGLYIGSRSIHQNVEWRHVGRCDKLVIKPPTTLASGTSTTRPETMAEGEAGYPSPPPEKVLDDAVLSAVVQISSNDYWLTADAGYCGPSTVWPEYSNIKPSCTNERSDPEPFKSDFAEVHHVLFEPIDTTPTGESLAGDGGHGDNEASEELGGIFAIENWPTFHDAAKGGLEGIMNTHRVVPIPAYDMAGNLIDPRHY
ncbi:hypothetical protein BDN67DRAFT_983613 [Paxillus ammoniavirescens]|nr:hypothetical protein BDN67DRAFT_983613 [Paxillus ammoniavirescens]